MKLSDITVGKQYVAAMPQRLRRLVTVTEKGLAGDGGPLQDVHVTYASDGSKGVISARWLCEKPAD